jgi:hypothetical protein
MDGLLSLQPHHRQGLPSENLGTKSWSACTAATLATRISSVPRLKHVKEAQPHFGASLSFDSVLILISTCMRQPQDHFQMESLKPAKAMACPTLRVIANMNGAAETRIGCECERASWHT